VEISEGFGERTDGDVVSECLELYAGYYRTPRRVDETIALVGLTERSDALAAELSGGQRRRLDVALALIGPARRRGRG